MQCALPNLVKDSVHNWLPPESVHLHLFPLCRTFIFRGRGRRVGVVRCLAKRKREGHPPQLRIVCRVYTHDNGPRQTHEQEVRRDTYDITTGTWRMKPCTAYVMRGPAGSYVQRSRSYFQLAFSPTTFLRYTWRLKRRVSSKPSIDDIGKRNQIRRFCVAAFEEVSFTFLFISAIVFTHTLTDLDDPSCKRVEIHSFYLM